MFFTAKDATCAEEKLEECVGNAAELHLNFKDILDMKGKMGAKVNFLGREEISQKNVA